MLSQDQATELEALFADFSDTLGPRETGVPGLGFYKASASGGAMPSVYDPCLCLIVCGRKEIRLGERVITYGGGDLLIASIDMPVTGCVVQASEAEPYLCIKIDLDRAVLGELAANMPALPPERKSPSGLVIGRADHAFTDAVLRLARLGETPDDIEALAPLAIREIHYRLLKSPEGGDIAAIAVKGSMLQRLAGAIGLLKDRFDEPISVEALAAAANMSASSFHHHFKALTGVSPIQYQKRLRLHEARHLMLTEGLTAANAAYRVGYESPAQFSRDYGRLFGAPPARDIRRLQAA